MDSVFGKLLEATQTALKGLALPGIADERIVTLSVPRATDQVFQTLPAVAIAPFGSESITAATNLSDDIGYPILIAIVDDAKNAPKLGDAMDARFLWRQRAIDHFLRNRMAGINGLMDQTIEPNPAIDPFAWGNGLAVSSFVVRFLVRTRRRAG